jgi:hypothetical protein
MYVLKVLFFSFCFVVAAGIGLLGCKSDRVDVQQGSTTAPQYAYRLDELALLQLLADDVFSSEREKQYAYIYDHLASPTFQKEKSRRDFLREANCVEVHLGALDTFNPNEKGFSRKKHGKETLDYLTRTIERSQETIPEELVIEPQGLQFQLRHIIWRSSNINFLNCLSQKIEIPPEELEAASSAIPSDAGSERSPVNRARSFRSARRQNLQQTRNAQQTTDNPAGQLPAAIEEIQAPVVNVEIPPQPAIEESPEPPLQPTNSAQPPQ